MKFEGDIYEKAKKVLGKETADRTAFTCFMIDEFAETHKIDKPNGYRYLKQYGGLDYIRKHWWALHINSLDYVLDDVFELCRKNGGYL